jgi:hypothetical protein
MVIRCLDLHFQAMDKINRRVIVRSKALGKALGGIWPSTVVENRLTRGTS